MRATSTIPTFEQGYTSLRPLLLHVLARLARQGFPVLPGDAVDLIHDFFLEEWDKVTTNFDASKGRFEPYVYGAFVHFARPRIVRLYRLQRDLVDPADLREIVRPDERSSEEELVLELDQAVLKEALQKLSQEEREILLDCFSSSEMSERNLARQYGLSRYKLRERLLTALGKVILHLNEQGKSSESDWKVARSLWADQRSIAETAACLGMTDAQVRYANQRNLKAVGKLLTKSRTSRNQKE